MNQTPQFSRIHISGEQAPTFLQNQVTCDIRQMSDRHAMLTTCCNVKGRMIASFYIYKSSADYYCLLPSDMLNILLKHLRTYAVFSKVSCETLADKITPWLDNSEKINIDTDSQLFTVSNQTIKLSEKPARYLSINDASKSIADINAWHHAEIHQGFALIRPATSSKLIPQMLNYGKFNALSFNKGCYLGQEVVARTQHLGKLKRHLYYATLTTTNTPAIGDELSTTDEPAGMIVNLAKVTSDTYELLAVLQDRLSEQRITLQDDVVSNIKKL